MAILLVLGQHAPTRPLIDGFVGVTVFFCLSGFLITTLLVDQLGRGTIELRAFYRRRAARLLPALLTVTVVTILVLRVDRRDLGLGQVLAPAAAATTYTTGLFDWSGHVFATKDYFNYTWSLSVEEQFYLLWPFALLWGYRRSPQLFATVAAAFAALSLALDLHLGLSRAVRYDPHEYFGSDTNALPILAGSLLAIVVVNGWLAGTLRRVATAAVPALALLLVVAHQNEIYRPALVIVAGTALTLVALVGTVSGPRSAAGALLASSPLRWLGERSYSIYLWNVLARIAVLATLGHSLVGDVVWIAMSGVLAEVSFRIIERPLRARFAPRPGASHPLRRGGQPEHPDLPVGATAVVGVGVRDLHHLLVRRLGLRPVEESGGHRDPLTTDHRHGVRVGEQVAGPRGMVVLAEVRADHDHRVAVAREQQRVDPRLPALAAGALQQHHGRPDRPQHREAALAADQQPAVHRHQRPERPRPDPGGSEARDRARERRVGAAPPGVRDLGHAGQSTSERGRGH